jgi:hypothetical protein
MNAKLILVVIATLIAAPSYAAERFGRDSVYVTQDAPTSKPVTGATVTRFGRDSVYATNSVASKQPVKVAVSYKAGRA